MHDTDQIEVAMRYHERTKHRFNRYADGPGQLDWANQPNPFRRYEGAPLVRLPLLAAHEAPRSPYYDDLYHRGSVPSAPLTIHALSRLLQYSLAISAWKQAGATRWALRCNPSSGNLHPTEAYLLIGALPGLGDAPGLYHYAPREHGLERRADCNAALLTALMHEFPAQAFLVGLSSIHWREAWKYGERAFRYCQHDVGHAIGALRIAAATLGWSAVLLHGLADNTIDDLLGLNRAQDFAGAEREQTDAVLAVWPTDLADDGQARAQLKIPHHLDPGLALQLARERWHGTANRLSRDDPVRWEVIDEVAVATRKPASGAHGFSALETLVVERSDRASTDGPVAGRIILQRRSLQACDGRTSIAADRLYRMLDRLMPRVALTASRRPMPWDTLAWDPTIQLGLFVHRVDGLEPGPGRSQGGGAVHSARCDQEARWHAGGKPHQRRSRGCRAAIGGHVSVASRASRPFWQRTVAIDRSWPGLRVRGRARQQSFGVIAWLANGSCQRAWGTDGPGHFLSYKHSEDRGANDRLNPKVQRT